MTDDDISALFERLHRPSPFSGDPNSTIHSTGLGGDNVGPVGWVENADGETGEANVFIDNRGLTVQNGKIFIEDYSGSSVLSAAGFEGAWLDFITYRAYNASFGAGAAGTLLATEVGAGSTVADYEASRSSLLPYWVVKAIPAAITLERVADADAASGFAVRATNSTLVIAEGQFYQDIPISAGTTYGILVKLKVKTAGTATELRVGQSWRDSNHALIGGEATSTVTTFATSYAVSMPEAANNAPANAAYLRVTIGLAPVHATVANEWVQVSYMALFESAHYGESIRLGGSDPWIQFGLTSGSPFLEEVSGRLALDSEFEISEAGGKDTLRISSTAADTGLTIGADTNLYRSAANVLKSDDALLSEAVGAIVFNSTTQSINNATLTALTFDSETSDPYGLHSTSSNTSRLTVPTGMGGVYMVVAHVTFAGNGTGERITSLFKNGAEVTRTQDVPLAADRTHTEVAWPISLAAGDYVEVHAYQTTGGALTTGSATAELANKFSMFRLG